MKEIDLDIGDIILTGKWKNKSVEVESFDTDDKGQPTVNGKAMLNFRIKKLMPEKTQTSVAEQNKMKVLAGIGSTIVQEGLLVEWKIDYPDNTPDDVRAFLDAAASRFDRTGREVTFRNNKWILMIKDSSANDWYEGGMEDCGRKIDAALNSSMKARHGKKLDIVTDREGYGVIRLTVGEWK